MSWEIIEGDCRTVLAALPERSVHTCVTSPPYFGLRSYLPDGVRVRSGLSAEQMAYVESELAKAGLL